MTTFLLWYSSFPIDFYEFTKLNNSLFVRHEYFNNHPVLFDLVYGRLYHIAAFYP